MCAIPFPFYPPRFSAPAGATAFVRNRFRPSCFGRRVCARQERVRASKTSNSTPAMTETPLAACAFDKPKNDRGLMRMNSTRKRATPVSDEIAAEDLAGGARAAHGAAADAPEKMRDHQGRQKFVDRRGMNALRGRHQSVGETHAPGQRRGNAVIAVAGNQAADAADAVAQGRGGRGHVQHQQHLHAIAPRQQDQRDESADHRAEPGKPHGAEEQPPRIGEKLGGTLERDDRDARRLGRTGR